MAAITTAGSGLWSSTTANAPWPSGTVPSDTDTVTIANGHTVTFDVDQTGWTGVNVTVNAGGTLTVAATGGPYYHMGTVTVNAGGTFTAGSVSSPLPFAVKFTNNGQIITAAKTLVTKLHLFGTPPTTKFVRLGALSAGGQKVVTLPATAQPNNDANPWAVGDEVILMRTGNATWEKRTIASFGTNSVTLTANLTNGHTTNDFIVLATRNVTVTYDGVPMNFASGGAGRFDNALCGRFIANSGSDGLSAPEGFYIKDSLFQCLNADGTNTAQNSYPIAWPSGDCSVSVDGLVTPGFNYAGLGTDGFVGSACATGCVFNYASSLSMPKHSVFSACYFPNQALAEATAGYITRFTGCYFVSSTPFPAVQGASYFSKTHQGTTGAVKFVSGGSSIVDNAITVQDGYSKSWKQTMTSSTVPGWYGEAMQVQPGETIRVRGWARKDFSSAAPPKVVIAEVAGDISPWREHIAGMALTSFTMTNSTNTWESFDLTWKNTTSFAKTLGAWLVAWDTVSGNGNIYWHFDRIIGKESW